MLIFEKWAAWRRFWRFNLLMGETKEQVEDAWQEQEKSFEEEDDASEQDEAEEAE